MATLQEQLRARSKQFALDVIRVCELLPNKPAAWVIGKQVLRSATSVAANYRATGRARSQAEFVAKMGVVVKEADETTFWLELATDAELLRTNQTAGLLREANELLRIFVASHNTAKGRA